MTPRRFPPPLPIEEANDAYFIVRDKDGQVLGYFYFEEEFGRRSAAKLLTRDEARPAGGQFRQAAGAAAPRSCRWGALCVRIKKGPLGPFEISTRQPHFVAASASL